MPRQGKHVAGVASLPSCSNEWEPLASLTPQTHAPQMIV